MKRLSIILLFVLCPLVGMNAQILPQYSEPADLAQLSAQTLTESQENASPVPEMELSVAPQKKPGTALLITAGCLTAVGAAMYVSSWGMISDSSSIGSVFSIAGLTCVGVSIPLYITGVCKRK